MTADLPPIDDETDPTLKQPANVRKRRDPYVTLNRAMVVYIFIDLLFALPLLIFPVAFFDAIGMDPVVADQMGGFRWVGAALLAWGVSGILVLARPGGRAIFVTTGALQLTFSALAFLYSWSLDEYGWSVVYHLAAAAVLVLGSVYMWWARFVGRAVFKGRPIEP